MRKSKEIWVKTGYTQFAIYGPEGINVDRLSGLVGKSRSSFYHNFGDRSGFEETLFEYHREQTLQVAAAIEPLNNMFPEYAEVIVGFRDWVFFHRQMFLLQDSNKKYKEVFERTIAVTSVKSSELWCKEAGLCNVPETRMKKFFETVRSAFFTRIEYHSFNAENYTKVVRELNHAFRFLVE